MGLKLKRMLQLQGSYLGVSDLYSLETPELACDF